MPTILFLKIGADKQSRNVECFPPACEVLLKLLRSLLYYRGRTGSKLGMKYASQPGGHIIVMALNLPVAEA